MTIPGFSVLLATALLAGPACAGVAVAAAAGAGPLADVVDIAPARGSTVATRTTAWVRIAYDSAQPLRFQARGRYNGTEVMQGAAMNSATVYPAGRGEALAWIAFHEPTILDGIAVEVYAADWRPLATLERSWPLQWRPGATAPPDPAWVATSRQRDEAAARAWQAALPPPEPQPGLDLLILLAGWSVPGYFVLQAVLLLRWRGRWRQAAALPLLGMMPLLAYTLFALLAGSNLWPLMLIFLTPLALLYLLVLVLARWLGGRGAAGAAT